MQSFGEYFKKYLEENSLSYSSVAKNCGIDRTILAKYAKGIMKPKNQQMVLQIAKGIQMPASKAQIMLEVYKKEMLCEKYGLSYQEIKDFLEIEYVLLNSTLTVEKKIYPEEYADKLCTYQDMIYALDYLLEKASFIKMKFDPESEKIQDILKQHFLYKNDCQIEQVLVLKNNSSVSEKLRYLYTVCPSLFYMKNGSVYYQYMERGSETCYGWIPDYIMTDKGIILCDGNLEQMFFSNQRVACDFYREMFDMQKAECRIFATGGKTVFCDWNNQNLDFNIINDRTGICFSGSAKGKFWISMPKKQQSICIREWELVEVLMELF